MVQIQWKFLLIRLNMILDILFGIHNSKCSLFLHLSRIIVSIDWNLVMKQPEEKRERFRFLMTAAGAIGHPWIFIPESTKAVCLFVSSFGKPLQTHFTPKLLPTFTHFYSKHRFLCGPISQQKLLLDDFDSIIKMMQFSFVVKFSQKGRLVHRVAEKYKEHKDTTHFEV